MMKYYQAPIETNMIVFLLLVTNAQKPSKNVFGHCCKRKISVKLLMRLYTKLA